MIDLSMYLKERSVTSQILKGQVLFGSVLNANFWFILVGVPKDKGVVLGMSRKLDMTLHWKSFYKKLALHSGFHEAYKLHSPTNYTTTPPFTSTNELIHDCNPINTETHHQQTPLPPNVVTILSNTVGKYKSEGQSTAKLKVKVLPTEPIPPTSSVTALRILMIKKGEYDLWSMKMRQYIAITDHILWDIITNGDQATTDPASSSGPVSAPKTSLAANARRNNEKALNILLSAIPDRHLLSFHDAEDGNKILWSP
ncbi:hypothetical protein Tco_0190149 [Tanacetum coccineum]